MSKPAKTAKPYAQIHHYSEENLTDFDDDGDLRLGWYFQFFDSDDKPTSNLYGPYSTNAECEKACVDEWLSN
jgi:hypothetical protein